MTIEVANEVTKSSAAEVTGSGALLSEPQLSSKSQASVDVSTEPGKDVSHTSPDPEVKGANGTQHIVSSNMEEEKEKEKDSGDLSDFSSKEEEEKKDSGLAEPEVGGVDDNDKGATPNNNNAMALNVAYEALEQVRQANVAIEFGRELSPKECVLCLRESQSSPYTTSRFRMPKLNRAASCLTCGTPVCPKHRCAELKRENINICVDCAAFFSLDEFVKKIHSTEEPEMRRRQMNSMLDVYDRALLILQYSSQYIEEIATALEHNTKRNNQIGLGSSATGFVSGIAGVAAAVTIFTPAGPPLLIASILFGGGATAASASSEAVNYHCSANKMADTIYALHGMVHSISRLAIEGHLWERQSAQDGGASSSSQSNQLNAGTNKAQARNWTRATANALKPLTAGALSAASVVMEAREMRNTLDKINAGNPCEKAESLRKIGKELDLLPSTSLLAEIAPRFFRLDETNNNDE